MSFLGYKRLSLLSKEGFPIDGQEFLNQHAKNSRITKNLTVAGLLLGEGLSYILIKDPILREIVCQWIGPIAIAVSWLGLNRHQKVLDRHVK